MRCPYCNGKGRVEYPMYADKEQTIQNAVLRFKTCAYCNGTGEVTMTNEEYIRSCSTEELAKLIYKIAVTDVLMDRFFTAEVVNAEIVDVDSGIKEAKAWLKEKHE